ncbi:hypothetical protein GON03_18975 [Nocardioides sp. MAH-18]|uniref:Uncharacterized protein n=1 Tax=Nocardioides agri TaxID=2682843 RepID=A0A6L6XVQ3_9ACTN|nr:MULTISPECIES: hypothetical protein [unclassified Nocardioides]MBA2952100.1 hypothetical protein [Nocardioides sp. CGMCC 1.13656]MVQ51269.1 hypothetical protein [Nocardioides sp. MAH-18]
MTLRGRPACPCLVQWLPVYEAELLRRGVIQFNIDIFQLIGNAPASAGVHSKGGAFDIGQTQREAVEVARQMGADATWARTTGAFASNRHTHGVLRDCPHNGPARYQIDAVDAGFNGLGREGRGGPDDGPRPLSGRTWREGIEWARRQQAAYHWFQPGDLGSAESGSALGVRKSFGDLLDPTVVVGSNATSEGGGIRRRSILRARVVTTPPRKRLSFPVAAGHAPPPRAPKARSAFMTKLAKVPARFKGGDMNVSGPLAARLTGRRVVGDGVLWMTVPRLGWEVLSTVAVDVGGDHKAVLARMRHKKTGVVVRILVINAMSVSAGAAKSSEILAAGLALKPHVVLASECADFRAVDVDAIHRNQEKP